MHDDEIDPRHRGGDAGPDEAGAARPPTGSADDQATGSRGEPAADTAEAIAARRRAIARGAPRPFDEDERETAYGLLQRGLALSQRRHNAQAAVVLARAAAMEPGRGSILEALGRAYYNSGQVERARETFEQLLEIDPSSHYGHYALGQSLKRLGQLDAAGTHLRMAAALDPASSLYRFALARLPEPDPGRRARELGAPGTGNVIDDEPA
jgi:tetratricopeptide (TPR) repeat protein